MKNRILPSWLAIVTALSYCTAGCGAVSNDDDDDDTTGDGDADADSDADADADADSDADTDADADGDADGNCTDPIPLALDTPQSGDTTDALGLGDPTCGDSAGQPARAYTLDVPAAGVLTVDVVPDGFSAVVAVRDTCADTTGEACGAPDAARAPARAVYCAAAPGTVAVVVDGWRDADFGPQFGAYTLTASLGPTCTGEEICVNGVGCKLPRGDTCDLPGRLTFDEPIRDTTEGATNDVTGGCTPEDGPDLTYAFSVDTPGVVSWTLEADRQFAALARLSSDCSDPGAELWCDPVVDSRGACVPAGDYTLTVDGNADPFQPQADAGAFTLTAHFAPCDEDEACQFGRCQPPLDPEVEPNDDGATAMTIADGDGVAGTLEANDAVDYYAIELTAGQRLIADLAGCNFDPVIFAYAAPLPNPLPTDNVCPFGQQPPGGAVACNDDNNGLCSRLDFVAPADGTYFLRIVSYSGNSNGDYPLVIDVL